MNVASKIFQLVFALYFANLRCRLAVRVVVDDLWSLRRGIEVCLVDIVLLFVVGAWVMSSDGLRSASATSPNAVDTQRGAFWKPSWAVSRLPEQATTRLRHRVTSAIFRAAISSLSLSLKTIGGGRSLLT